MAGSFAPRRSGAPCSPDPVWRSLTSPAIKPITGSACSRLFRTKSESEIVKAFARSAACVHMRTQTKLRSLPLGTPVSESVKYPRRSHAAVKQTWQSWAGNGDVRRENGHGTATAARQAGAARNLGHGTGVHAARGWLPQGRRPAERAACLRSKHRDQELRWF